MADPEGALDRLGEDDREDVSVRRRTLELLCARRAAVTVGFVLSGMMFFASLSLVLFADISAESEVIALVDLAITGALLAATAFVLRLCRRLREGDGIE
ncbi:MAG: hypothetical protein ABEJ40_02360 [Haloarculaceae archaeon]